MAHARPFLEVECRELVQVVQEQVGLERVGQTIEARDGQILLTEAAQLFRSAVEYHGEVAGLLRPEPRTPHAVMDPQRSFGQPTARNVRTESLAEDHRAGTSRDELEDRYDLTVDQVDEAIRFELTAGAARAA